MSKTWKIVEQDNITGECRRSGLLDYNPIERMSNQQHTIDQLLDRIRRVTEAITEEVEIEFE
jgi:hypothetical protein